MNPFAPSAAPLSVTVLVLPGSSMMTVASVLDPMRACNRISRGERIAWAGGQRRRGAGRADLRPAARGAGALAADAAGDLLIVVAGFDVLRHADRALLARLRRAMPRFAAVAGIEVGAWVLGAAGVLAGRRATTHWEDLEEFAARFPEAEVVADRYVIDGRIFTAGGASPAFDLILHLIRSRFGAAVALDVASVFVYDEAHAAIGRAAAGVARPARGARAAGGGGDPADGGARSTGRWRAPRSRGGSGCRCARSRRCSAGRSASGRRPTACSSGCRRRAGW